MIMKRISFFICLFSMAIVLNAQIIYVDAQNGDDSHIGNEVSPIKTLKKAAEKINESQGFSSTEIILKEGIYTIDSAVIFKPTQKYSPLDRFIIRAEILPDEPSWRPDRMPVILPLLLDQKEDNDGTWSNGIQVEVSHATVQGLKIMGSPTYEHIDKNKIVRSYPIVREGGNLEDLVITQCLFSGDQQILPLHLGIYAAGHKVLVDHCLFYNCKVGVLYVNYNEEETTGNALTNNLFINSYGAAIWIMNTSEDFTIKGNSVINSNYAFILEAENTKKYRVENSLFANNLEIAGHGSGALLNFSPLSINALHVGSDVRITSKKFEINFDQSKRDYLHILTDDQNLYNSGLFTKR